MRTSTWVYYSKKTVLGQPHHRSQDPCILISNHPGTVLDPLNVAVEAKDEVHFLANASLFNNPVLGWLLRKFYCIPVQRPQDVGGKPVNNAENFRQAVRFLSGKGCLYIAPEGSSYVERRLRKLKTGTARIAFATEAANDWQLGLIILPVGLNYTDPTKFRSRCTAFFGEPIRVADFREQYKADAVNAVQRLTDAMTVGLSSLILDCDDHDQDQLLYRLDAMLRNEEPLATEAKLRRSQRVLERLKRWKSEDVAGYSVFSALVFDYFERIKLLKINDLHVKKPKKPASPLFYLTLSFPLFALGYAIHFLPCFTIKKLAESIKAELAWMPTFKYGFGLLLYPLFIGLETWLVGKLAVSLGLEEWYKWIFLLAVVPLGLVTERWLRNWKLWQRWTRAEYIYKNETAIWSQLTDLRQRILSTEQIFGN